MPGILVEVSREADVRCTPDKLGSACHLPQVKFCIFNLSKVTYKVHEMWMGTYGLVDGTRY